MLYSQQTVVGFHHSKFMLCGWDVLGQCELSYRVSSCCIVSRPSWVFIIPNIPLCNCMEEIVVDSNRKSNHSGDPHPQVRLLESTDQPFSEDKYPTIHHTQGQYGRDWSPNYHGQLLTWRGSPLIGRRCYWSLPQSSALQSKHSLQRIPNSLWN